MSQHQGLPVAGYQPQSDEALALVNSNKQAEELILRTLDALRDRAGTDLHWLAVGRMSIEQGFMAVNRAIMKPRRVALPEDTPPPASSSPVDTLDI